MPSVFCFELRGGLLSDYLRFVCMPLACIVFLGQPLSSVAVVVVLLSKWLCPAHNLEAEKAEFERWTTWNGEQKSQSAPAMTTTAVRVKRINNNKLMS